MGVFGLVCCLFAGSWQCMHLYMHCQLQLQLQLAAGLTRLEPGRAVKPAVPTLLIVQLLIAPSCGTVFPALSFLPAARASTVHQVAVQAHVEAVEFLGTRIGAPVNARSELRVAGVNQLACTVKVHVSVELVDLLVTFPCFCHYIWHCRLQTRCYSCCYQLLLFFLLFLHFFSCLLLLSCCSSHSLIVPRAGSHTVHSVCVC